MPRGKKPLETTILAQPPKQIVGIAGGTASGKTTLAKLAAEALGPRCLLISHDRYYLDVLQPIGHNYDAPEALDNRELARNLAELAAGHPTDLPIYDFASHCRQAKREWVQPAEIVLVEGILVLAVDAIRNQLQSAVFVDAPEPVRLQRRIDRDQVQRGRSRESILDQYNATVKPMHNRHVEPSRLHADLLLDGNGPLEDALTRLMELLQSSSSA